MTPADDTSRGDTPTHGPDAPARRRREDPVQRRTADSEDLYEVATWERRSALDAAASAIYRGIVLVLRLVVVLVAAAVLVALLGLAGFASINDPVFGVFVFLSIVPALVLVAYVWHLDPTTKEKVGPMVATFLLGILLASFAAVGNSLLQPFFQAIPVVGTIVFFYLVVAPIEETVKLLAVRLWAYEHAGFDAVVDGAVYGAIAGLGFATIENVLYIGRQYLAAEAAGAGVIGRSVGTTVLRSLAGPGHVIYSAIAGYYLGLAKFNPRDAGPLVVKGLVIAALIHGTYNTLVGIVPALFDPALLAFLGFVIVYDGIFFYFLYRKLRRYRSVYESVGGREAREEARG
jgi:RsiW-degrading membrane proteinase PrsW (M82 family)